MLINVNQDRFGNLCIDPVSDRERERASRHLRTCGVKVRDSEAIVYLQGGAASEFIAYDVPARRVREIEDGYTARIRIGRELWSALIGYDYP